MVWSRHRNSHLQCFSIVCQSNLLAVFVLSLFFHKSVKPHRVLTGHTQKVQCFLNVHDTVWSGDSAGDILIWSTEVFFLELTTEAVWQTFDCITTLKAAHGGSIFCMICTKPERKEHEVWSCGKDHQIRIWDSEARASCFIRILICRRITFV